MRKFALCSLLMGLLPQAFAQKPSFEVVSVKLNNSGSSGSSSSGGPGMYRAINVTPRFLILNSYGVMNYQLVGAPPWVSTTKFDIEARLPSGVSDPDIRAMTRSMLEERFELKSHRETKELPVYVLTVAQTGPKLHTPIEGRTGPGGLNPGSSRANITAAGGEILASGVDIARLIEIMVPQVGRLIVDKTNLTVRFDLSLKWSTAPASTAAVPVGAVDPAADPVGPSIFTALQEQLGLRLESGTAPIEVLVIDSIQKPSEN